MMATDRQLALGLAVALVFTRTGFCPAQGVNTGAWETIVVTASGFPRLASKTPGGVGVVSAGDVEGAVSTGAADAAARIPGVERASDGPWGSDVSIRGMSRDSVVMLVDGFRLNTATDIAARFGTIDPRSIERIEVLKGPVSALYGSGSLGGVVNVITRAGTFSEDAEWRGGLAASWKSNPEGFGVRGRASYSDPERILSLALSSRDFGSYSDGDGIEVTNSQFQDSYAELSAAQKFGAEGVVRARAQYYRGHEIGVPGGGQAPLPAAADVTYPVTTRLLVGLDAEAAPFGSGTKSVISIFRQSVGRGARIDNFPASSPIEKIETRADHDTYGARWLNAVAVGNHSLVLGADAWERQLESLRFKTARLGTVLEERPLPVSASRSVGAFFEDDWAAGESVTLNTGARVDGIRARNDATDQWPEGSVGRTSWNAHVGGSWRITEQFMLKLTGASGYRAASLEEMFQYLDLGGGTVKLGNPELSPERSLFAEAGLGWYGEAVFLSVSAYVNHLDDLISEKRADATTFVNANVDRAMIHGFECEARWAASKLVEVYGNAACAIGRDTGAGADLPGIPPLSGTLGVSCGSVRGIAATIEISGNARQAHVPAGEEETPGWAIVNARIKRVIEAAGSKHILILAANNLFDKAYRNHLTSFRGLAFDEPGRSVCLTYEVEF